MKTKLFEGGKCRFCTGILSRKEIKPKLSSNSWRKKAYHFKACLKCSNCGQRFNLNETKYKTEDIIKQSSLF